MSANSHSNAVLQSKKTFCQHFFVSIDGAVASAIHNLVTVLLGDDCTAAFKLQLILTQNIPLSPDVDSYGFAVSYANFPDIFMAAQSVGNLPWQTIPHFHTITYRTSPQNMQKKVLYHSKPSSVNCQKTKEFHSKKKITKKRRPPKQSPHKPSYFARSIYSPVRVSIRIKSPSLTNIGTISV